MRAGADQEEKRTNEIGAIIPLLDTLPDSALAGRVVTVDALLTQRALANYPDFRNSAVDSANLTIFGLGKCRISGLWVSGTACSADLPP